MNSLNGGYGTCKYEIIIIKSEMRNNINELKSMTLLFSVASNNLYLQLKDIVLN